eukprot:403335977
MNDEPHELMSMEIDEEEEIQMIQFLDDESPQNVLLITYDYSLQKTVSRILNIRNETVNRFQDLKKEFEYKLNLQLMVESQLSQSKQARATFMHHNYFYSLDEKHSDFLVEQERSLMPSFVTNTADKGNSSFLSPNISSLSSIVQQENNLNYDTNSNNISKNSFNEHSDQSDKSENSGSQNSYHGMYASHGVNSVNSSQIFSFKDKQMYEIFDFQEQIINDGFTKVCYFNKDARRKILFTSNLKNQFYCFNIKQHIKMTTNTVSMFQATDKTHSNTPSTKVSRHQSQQDLSVLQQPSVQKNITPKKLAELPAVNPTKDKQSNSFKNSQAQIQEPSFQTQPPNPKIPKCVELHQDRLYVIYKRLPQIDILQVNGGLIQRIKLDEIVSREENMTLVKLKHLQFPVLQWSNRLHNKSDPQNQLVKIIVLGTLQVHEKSTSISQIGMQTKQTQLKQFVMVLNLQTLQIEQMKYFSLKPKVSCIQWGPYDNGYILMGFTSGMLLSLEYPSLKLFDQKQVFDGIYGGAYKNAAKITSISCEPTKLVFVGSENGQMIALSFVKEDVHYMYLDMGLRRYCTLKVNKKQKNLKSMLKNKQLIEDELQK